MDRLLARLDRRFGRFAIPGLPQIIAGGMAIVFALSFVRPDVMSLVSLSPRAIVEGQVWRAFSYVFLPPLSTMFGLEGMVILTLLNIYWIWMLGSALEGEWGAFKLNLYYLIAIVATTSAAFLVGVSGGSLYLDLSLLFAMATLFPDYEIRWFGILPITMRWLAWLSFAFVAYQFVTDGWATRAAILAAFSNYVLFFWSDIFRILRGRRTVSHQAARLASMAPPSPAVAAARACAICGAREADGADIRVCSCEKCKQANGGAARTLCLEHARDAQNH